MARLDADEAHLCVGRGARDRADRRGTRHVVVKTEEREDRAGDVRERHRSTGEHEATRHHPVVNDEPLDERAERGAGPSDEPFAAEEAAPRLTPLERVAQELDGDGRHDYLDQLGITAVQLLPVNEFAGDIGWGYNPSFFYAVESSYGTPDQLKALVDTAHRRGIAVILDVVVNHGGSGDNTERPGQCVDSGIGGFGGGGNGGNSGPGGGGYQGGDAGGLGVSGQVPAYGKGGRSFNSGVNPIAEDGVRVGHGEVHITLL